MAPTLPVVDDAWRTLYNDVSRVMLRMATAILGNSTDAEDAMAEAWIWLLDSPLCTAAIDALLRPRNSLNGDSQSAGEQLAVLRRQAISATWYRCRTIITHRQRSRNRGETGSEFSVDELMDRKAPAPDAALSPSLELPVEIDLEDLDECLDRLQPGMKAIVEMRYWDPHFDSLGQIAAALGITAEAARQSHHRALGGLRECLSSRHRASATSGSETV